MRRLASLVLFLALSQVLFAQKTDTLRSERLREVEIVKGKTVRGIGHLPTYWNGILTAGKKTEVILVDSLDANKAINNTRQILGRIPGLNIVETESACFTANGIAVRELNCHVKTANE